MAYPSEYLDALKHLPLSGYFVNEYFLQDKVLNSMRFNNGAVANSSTGLSYTVIRNNEVSGAAASREFGQDYNIVNASPTRETFYLTVLGGKYSVDLTQEEAINEINAENEAREKMNAAINEFARQLIKGTGTNGEFIGLDKYCTDNNLVSDVVLDVSGGITTEVAEKFYEDFNEILGELEVDANVIYVSRKMETKLVTIQGILQKYVQPVTIGKINYNSFLGIPIVPIANTVGMRFVSDGTDGLEDGVTYEDIFIARIDEDNGIFCASPRNRSSFVKVKKPVDTGSPIATGYVDFPTCLVVKNRKALIKARIKVTASDDTDLGV